MEQYLFIAGAVVVLVIVIIGILSFISRNYIKVAPNQVAVFFGRKYKTKDGAEVGFKVVTGGAKFKVPIIESVQMLDLSVFSIDLDVRKAPNKDGVPVNLKGVANVKILSDESSLMAACERFLHKTPQEIQGIAFKNLEGHLRGIAGRMSIEELVGDRTKLNTEVLNDAAADLKKLGLGVDLLTIQEVTDDTGYIEQLGKKRTAEVTKDAQIGKAEAEKQSTIQTTTAIKDAAITENENEIKKAESAKDRDVKKASFVAAVAKETATAQQAGPLATAIALKDVVVAEQDMEKTKIQKQTEVAEEEVKRTEKSLEATVIKPAEAEKKSAIVKAEANKEVQITEATGQQESMQKIAEGAKQKAILEGQGAAEAIKAKLLAEADGIRAKSLAEADGIKAKLLAEAEGRQAFLLAEAEGLLKKAEAYQKLEETGKLMQVLEAIERIAPAVVKEFAGVMEAAAKPLGNVDNISILDFGSGDATGKFASTVPGMIAKFFSMASGAGLDITGLAKKLGIDPTKLMEKANLISGEEKSS